MLSERAWKWFSPIHQGQLSHMSPPSPAASAFSSRYWHQLLLFQPFISFRRNGNLSCPCCCMSWVDVRQEGKQNCSWCGHCHPAKCTLPPFLTAAGERGECSGAAGEKSVTGQAGSRTVRLLTNTAFPPSPDPFLLYLSYSHCRLISFLILRLIFFRTAH